jgi:hypothetical protein
MRVNTRKLLRFHAAYYCASGLSPLVSMRLFEAVTGPKRDRWLVQMVGLLAATIGASLWASSQSEERQPAVLVLAIGAALSFAGIDVVHVLGRRISPIYLADAAIELVLAALLLGGEPPAT